jgi:branched-chain amino acid transport system substrate-binding protein
MQESHSRKSFLLIKYFNQFISVSPSRRFSVSVRFALLVIMSVILFYCGAQEEKGQWSGPARIGVVVPRNGPLQEEGEMLRLGTLMAIEEAGELVADHQIEMIVYDSPCNASAAIPVAEQIVADSSTSAVIGYLCPETIRAVLPIYREAHLALINPTVSAGDTRKDESRHLFPLLYGDGEQGAFLAAYAKKGLNLTRVAILSDGSIFGNILGNFFLQEANRLGLELVENIFVNPKPEEAARAVGILKSAGPEAILLAASPKAASLLLIEHRRQKVFGVVLGPDRFADLDFYEMAGQAAEGLLVCQPILLDHEDSENFEFVRRFEEFTKRRPNWIAVAGYDSMRLALEVLSRSGPKRNDFLGVIRQISGPGTSFRGIGGPIFFKEDGTSQRPFFVAEVHKGRMRPAKPPTVEFPVTLLGGEK